MRYIFLPGITRPVLIGRGGRLLSFRLSLLILRRRSGSCPVSRRLCRVFHRSPVILRCRPGILCRCSRILLHRDENHRPLLRALLLQLHAGIGRADLVNTDAIGLCDGIQCLALKHCVGIVYLPVPSSYLILRDGDRSLGIGL